MWRRLQADGCEWEVRAVMHEEANGQGADPDAREVLEFRAVDGLRRPRRVAGAPGLEALDDAALLAAFRRARPIGGDYYGRPGKLMSDV